MNIGTLALIVAMFAVAGIVAISWRGGKRDSGTFNDLTDKMREILRGRKE